jgi:hypothetical protein
MVGVPPVLQPLASAFGPLMEKAPAPTPEQVERFKQANPQLGEAYDRQQRAFEASVLSCAMSATGAALLGIRAGVKGVILGGIGGALIGLFGGQLVAKAAFGGLSDNPFLIQAKLREFVKSEGSS